MAQEGCKRAGVENVVLCQGNMRDGLKRQSPFWYIVMEGSVSSIPVAYFEQLEEGSPGVFAVTHIDGQGPCFCRFFQNDKGTIERVPLLKKYSLKCPSLKKRKVCFLMSIEISVQDFAKLRSMFLFLTCASLGN
ncbi:MAG: hypothetical protein H6925_03765 [Holosporaceae bacterium]|nr:MAG: hypothetical protein H6925_03765 [Holosporaceae bacterium]